MPYARCDSRALLATAFCGRKSPLGDKLVLAPHFSLYNSPLVIHPRLPLLLLPPPLFYLVIRPRGGSKETLEQRPTTLPNKPFKVYLVNKQTET